MARIIINLVVFDVVWFMCVWGAGSGRAWLGPLTLLGALGLHLWLAPCRRGEARFLAVAAAVGFGVETANGLLGVLVYTEGWPGIGPAWMAPLWLVAMWINFGTVLSTSLRWMAGRPMLGALFGAVAGPVAYFFGSKFGGVTVGPNPTLSYLGIGIVYAMATPGLLWIAERVAPVPNERTPAPPAGG